MPWFLKREPPSRRICEPVICDEAGEDRNKASPAMSDGAPKRPVGRKES